MIKFKKFICSLFGCKIKKTISSGFFHVECHRCGDVFSIKRSEGGNWQDRAMGAILTDTALFGGAINIECYRKGAQKNLERKKDK